MNRTQALQLAGYAGFFWFWFALFAYWTFPYDRVAAYLTDRIDRGGSGYSLEIGSLSSYWITGIEFEDVKVRHTGASALKDPAEPKAQGAGFRIEEARARLGLLSLLIGNQSVNFDAEFEQGEVDGNFTDSGDSKHVEATLSKVELSKLGIIESHLSLPVKGELGGDVVLTIGKEPAQTSGSLELQIRGLTIGDGKAKVKLGGMGGLTIDPIEAGNVTVEFDVKAGVGTIKKLSTDGKDLELKGSGEIRFADPVTRSRVDLLLRIKFTDTYKNKSSRTKALFGLLEGAAPPQVRAAQTPDGALQFRLVGTLGGARATPAGRAADPAAQRGARSRRAARVVEGEQEDDDERN